MLCYSRRCRSIWCDDVKPRGSSIAPDGHATPRNSNGHLDVDDIDPIIKTAKHGGKGVIQTARTAI